jgi:hypothetical protein
MLKGQVKMRTARQVIEMEDRSVAFYVDGHYDVHHNPSPVMQNCLCRISPAMGDDEAVKELEEYFAEYPLDSYLELMSYEE